MGRKIYSYLTSMQFWLLLLGLIIAVSIAGSLIAQNEAAMYYVRTYPQLYSLILALKLNQVFTSWYFLLLVILLCLNLTLCTLKRMTHFKAAEEVPSAFTPSLGAASATTICSAHCFLWWWRLLPLFCSRVCFRANIASFSRRARQRPSPPCLNPLSRHRFVCLSRTFPSADFLCLPP